MSNDLSQYYAIQHLLKTGDLIEWRGNSLVARAIRAFTGNVVNHSSVVIMVTDGPAERRKIIEAVETGLELGLLSRKLEKHGGQAWWYGLKPEYDHLRPAIRDWMLERLSENNGYDYGSLFKQIAGRVSLDARNYFCSEYFDHMLIEHGIAKPDPKGARRPGDFARLGIFSAQAQIA